MSINESDTKNQQQINPWQTFALKLYDLGLSLVPLQFMDKKAVLKWTPLQTERLSREDVERWGHKCYPGLMREIPHNIGIITGALSGIVVVDGDNAEACNYIEANLPATPIRVKSAKGAHYYYRYPAGVCVRNFQHTTVNGGVSGIDLRAEGGLTVGPGSIHKSGCAYEFAGDWSKWEQMPVYDPSWLVPDQTKPTASEFNPEDVACVDLDGVDLDARQEQAREYLRTQPGSTQGKGADNRCFALACEIVHGYALSAEEALPLMLEWGTKASNVDAGGDYYPWTEQQLAHKLTDAENAEPKDGLPTGYKLRVDPAAELAAVLGEVATPSVITPEPAADTSFFESLVAAKAAPVQPVAPVGERKRRGYKIADLDLLPEAEFLVKDHLTAYGCNVLYGASGSYKSFVALDMSLCIATGKPYLGLYPVRQGNVAYICSEGSAGIKKRVRGWLAHHGIKKAPENIIFIPSAFDLMKIEEVKEISKIVGTDLGAQPDLLVIDTLARNFGSGDENSTQDMNEYVRLTDLFSTCGARLHIHHSGWGEGKRERGSSVLRGAADTILEAAKQDDGRVKLSCKKAKDAEPFMPYYLKPQTVTGTLVFDYDGRESPDRNDDDMHKANMVKLLTETPSGLSTKLLTERCGLGRDKGYQLVNELKSQSVIVYDNATKRNRLNDLPDLPRKV